MVRPVDFARYRWLLQSRRFFVVTRSSRTPVYGWLIDLLTLGTSSFAIVPSLHLSVFIGGVRLLAASLLRFGLSEIAVISLSGTLLFSNAVLLLTSWVHPELLAIACLALRNILRFRMLACEKAPQGRWPYLGVLIGAGLSVPDAAELSPVRGIASRPMRRTQRS